MGFLDRTGEALGLRTIKVEKEELNIRTEIGDVRTYLKEVQKLKENNDLTGVIDLQFNFLEKLLTQGNPNKDKKIISFFVEEYFKELLEEVMIALRLTTRKDILNSKEAQDLKN